MDGLFPVIRRVRRPMVGASVAQAVPRRDVVREENRVPLEDASPPAAALPNDPGRIMIRVVDKRTKRDGGA